MAQQPKKDDITKAYELWKSNPTSDNLGLAVKAAEPTISSAIKTYAGKGNVKSKAKLLTIGALNSFKNDKGASLSTHIYSQLQPLRREALKRSNVLGVSERYTQEKARIRDARTDFLDRFDRDPSDDELADEIGLSPKRINFLDKVNNSTLSEGKATESAGEDDDASLPGVASASKEDTWASYVHHDSSPLDQKILEWKTGFGGKPILSAIEIAKRLNLTPASISQRSAKLSKRIGEGLV